MIGHLVSCRLHHLLRPFRHVTEPKLHHVSTGFADNMMMVAFHLTELILDLSTQDDPEHNPQRFEKIETAIDRCQPTLVQDRF
jgi:hypothetical protein